MTADGDYPKWWTDAGLGGLLSPRADVVPVVGAGVAKAANVPDGAALARWLIGRLDLHEPENGKGRSLFAVVDAIDDARRGNVPKLVAEYVKSFPYEPSSFLMDLVHLPSRFIVTLNYDDLIGVAAERQGIPVRRLSGLDRGEASEAHSRLTGKAKSWPPGELTVLHLHGQARSPETLVLDGDSYQLLLRSSEVQDIVFMLSHLKAMAFVGTRLDEPYLLAALQRQVNAAFHVLLCREAEVDELRRGRAALSERQHLRVVGYPTHDELLVLPRWLCTPPEPRTSPRPARPADPRSLPDPAEYVPSEFSERSLGAPSPQLSERDIRDGQRTLVVGAAGSGKTHLLSWLAANALPERPAVHVRLADVRIAPGAPETILHRWAGCARSAITADPVDVGPSKISQGKLHFLLDGLDEVDNTRQDLAASLVVQVAERFPQHAFTVTSRPLPALAALGGAAPADATPWRVIDLTPGRHWQARYLVHHELTLEDLERAMPALGDMRELLHIPFFLSRTVELYANDRLTGLKDVGGLLERLIDFSLLREEALLPLIDTGIARRWLQRVALAGGLAGRRTFSPEELATITVPGDMAGNLSDLIEQLQLRLLLTEENGEIRFAHRLLADEAMAEALAEVTPTHELLDALVPEADLDLAGVRDDVVIAVSLLCLRSAPWRRGVAQRDPLAAARATPSDASLDERRAAVERLWNVYADWGIWAWSRDVPDLLDDAEVIARLLRHDPDGPHIPAIRRLAHDGDYIQQGNAIRVLARVAPPGFEGDLSRVLRDNDRNGVVIRQAAIAALDLRLTNLIDDIVYAVRNSTDSAVHQDASIALRGLVPDDRLLEVAKRLADRDDGNLLAPSLIQGRLSPDERIEYAEALALAGADVMRTDREDLSRAARDLAAEDVASATVRRAACAATLWREHSPEVTALLARDPVAAALGLLDARSHGAESWQLAFLAPDVDLDVLRAAGVEPVVIERAEQVLELRAMPPAAREDLRRSIEESFADDVAASAGTRTSEPRLAELLRRPPQETSDELQRYAFRLRDDVASLSEAHKEELGRRLRACWPATPLSDHIEWRGGERFAVRAPASALIWLVPELRFELTDEQWAQFATLPVAMSDRVRWLCEQATPARMQRAMSMLADNRASTWRKFLNCCPEPLPRSVVSACIAEVTSDDDEPRETEMLVQRLGETAPTDALRAWGRRDEVAAGAVLPLFAERGDVTAQRALMDRLLDDVRRRALPLDDELGWMASLVDPVHLEALFEILRLSFTHPRPPDASAAFHYRDVVSPTIEAIAKIGTREAVRRYDDLLSIGGDARWLRSHRDRVARDLLRALGTTSGTGGAAAAGVPALRH